MLEGSGGLAEAIDHLPSSGYKSSSSRDSVI
jgi:hypothetical protein